LSLHEKHRALGIGGGIFNGFKGLQSVGGKIAKQPVGAQLAGKTAFYDIESVW
jgi:hypothetical protein